MDRHVITLKPSLIYGHNLVKLRATGFNREPTQIAWNIWVRRAHLLRDGLTNYAPRSNTENGF